MREHKCRVWWIHPESSSQGFNYFDVLEGWQPNDPCQELVEVHDYTGKDDKNGTPIYEGDIASTISKYSSVNYEVYWDGRACQFRCCARGDKPFDKTHDLLWVSEVLGNKFENPELLEESK